MLVQLFAMHSAGMGLCYRGMLINMWMVVQHCILVACCYSCFVALHLICQCSLATNEVPKLPMMYGNVVGNFLGRLLQDGGNMHM